MQSSDICLILTSSQKLIKFLQLADPGESLQLQSKSFVAELLGRNIPLPFGFFGWYSDGNLFSPVHDFIIKRGYLNVELSESLLCRSFAFEEVRFVNHDIAVGT